MIGIVDKRRDVDYIKGLLWLILSAVQPVIILALIGVAMACYYGVKVIQADLPWRTK